MALNLPIFYQRTASAAVFAVVMLTGLLWNKWSFLALILLINGLCLREYIRLLKRIIPDTYWPSWLPTGIQIIAILVVYYWSDSFLGVKVLVFFVPFLALAISVFFMISILSKKTALPALSQAMGGLFYITVPMLFLLGMRTYNSYIPLILILMIWSNDTMAYLVGSFIGKTPFSAISPKKTWEGTGGGALLTIAGAAVCGYYLHQFSTRDWMALALCATIFGTLGDLVESKLKRMADVKDSGALMPGHGGALDRFDSLLLAAPFAGVYVLYFMG